MNRKPQDMETLYVKETRFSRVKHPVSLHAETTHPRIPTAEPLILLHVMSCYMLINYGYPTMEPLGQLVPLPQQVLLYPPSYPHE